MRPPTKTATCRGCRQITQCNPLRSATAYRARSYATPVTAAPSTSSSPSTTERMHDAGLATLNQTTRNTKPHPSSSRNHSYETATPRIPYAEYEERRRRLMDSLPDQALVVCCGARVQYMSQSIFYKFRQGTNFAYLTGFNEPDAAVVLQKSSRSSNRRGYTMRLFCQPEDKRRERWDGPRTGVQGAVDMFGADEAEDIEGLARYLNSVLPTWSGPVYLDLPAHATNSRVSKKSSRSIISLLSETQPPTSALDVFKLGRKKGEAESVVALLTGRNAKETRALSPLVERLRLSKSKNEVALMRKAAELSSEAHAQVMRFARPGMSEAALVAHFEYICALGGAERLAYVPVCASAERALTIHYTANNQAMPPNSLVLIDAGCEYQGYASDITRTFPVDGVFTDPQKDLYQAVLNVTKACTKLCRENTGLSMQGLHNESNKLLREELRQLGFTQLLTTLDDVYPHFLSHPLGADLHDTPTFGRHEPIQAGQVLTIEPGVYVPDSPSMPKAFRGLAVRIEDEVLVGQTDYTVLSANCPKEVADVEAMCLNKLENRLQVAT